MFKEFRLIYCHFTIIAEEAGAKLPALKGNLFHDQNFKESIYRHFCRMKNTECEKCSTNMLCPYSFMYKNIPVWKSQHYGSIAPFTWKPPLAKKTVYMKGEKINLSLVLVGNSLKYLEKMIKVIEDYLIITWHTFGKFILKEVVTENPFTKEKGIIYSNKTGFNDSAAAIVYGYEIELWAKNSAPVNRISLTFLAPTCFKYKNEYIVEPHFYFLIKELVLKIQTLYYFYHNRRELNMEYQNYLQQAEDILKVSDHSRFVPVGSSLQINDEAQGLLGKIKYAGKLDEFLPLLKLGEFVHIGEKAVLGFGRYRFTTITQIRWEVP